MHTKNRNLGPCQPDPPNQWSCVSTRIFPRKKKCMSLGVLKDWNGEVKKLPLCVRLTNGHNCLINWRTWLFYGLTYGHLYYVYMLNHKTATNNIVVICRRQNRKVWLRIERCACGHFNLPWCEGVSHLHREGHVSPSWGTRVARPVGGSMSQRFVDASWVLASHLCKLGNVTATPIPHGCMSLSPKERNWNPRLPHGLPPALQQKKWTSDAFFVGDVEPATRFWIPELSNNLQMTKSESPPMPWSTISTAKKWTWGAFFFSDVAHSNRKHELSNNNLARRRRRMGAFPCLQIERKEIPTYAMLCHLQGKELDLRCIFLRRCCTYHQKAWTLKQ